MKFYIISKKYIYNNYCVFDEYLNFEVVVVEVLRFQIWFMGSIFLSRFIFHFRNCVYSIDLIEIITMKRLKKVIIVVSVGEIYKCI